MGSVRISPQLQEKLRLVSAKKGITRSEVFRQALETYCEHELTPPTHSRFEDVIGIVEGPADGSTRVTEHFVEGLVKKHD